MREAQSPVRLQRLTREQIVPSAQLAGRAFASEAVSGLVHEMLTIHCDTAGDTPLDEQSGVLLFTEYYTLCDSASGEVVGLSGLYRTAWTHPTVGSLGWFCISPTRQREGLGRLLLVATMRVAVNRGMSRMVVETSPDADAALRLYRDLGFEECGRVPGYFGSGVPLLLLTRSLDDVGVVPSPDVLSLA